MALGEQWGKTVAAGTILGLSGDLGAGKTQLVIGLARGLGLSTRIQSPTFGLVHEYAGGRLPLAHLDLYRLETPSQIAGAGLDQYFEKPSGLVVVEWCERWPAFQPGGHPPVGWRHVTIEAVDENSRRITYDDPRA